MKLKLVRPDGTVKSPTGKKKKEPLSEFERYKLKLERGRRMRLVMGVTVLSLAVVVGVAGFGLLSDSEFGNDFRTSIQKATQFPIPLAGRVVQQIEPMNWNFAVVDESSLCVYNDKGAELQTMEHGYATPVLKTAGDRLLIYDQGGNRFKVGSDSRELFSGESVTAIHCADVAQNGTFALATSSNKSASEIRFYNEYGNEIFTWQSSSMVVGLTLSPDGKQAAACLLSAEDGAVVTTVALLDLQNPQLVFKADFPEEFGYVVRFKQSSLTLITDQSVRQIDWSGRSRVVYDFNGRQVQQYADGGLDHLVLVLGSSRYMRSNQIVTLDERCRELGNLEVESAVDELRAGTEGFTFLSDGAVLRYDYACEPFSRVTALGAMHYLILGQNLYASTYEQIQHILVR